MFANDRGNAAVVKWAECKKTFLLNTYSRWFESCLKSYFHNNLYFFIVYYLMYDQLLTNAFPYTNIGFLSLYYGKLNKIKRKR